MLNILLLLSAARKLTTALCQPVCVCVRWCLGERMVQQSFKHINQLLSLTLCHSIYKFECFTLQFHVNPVFFSCFFFFWMSSLSDYSGNCTMCVCVCVFSPRASHNVGACNMRTGTCCNGKQAVAFTVCTVCLSLVVFNLSIPSLAANFCFPIRKHFYICHATVLPFLIFVLWVDIRRLPCCAN